MQWTSSTTNRPMLRAMDGSVSRMKPSSARRSGDTSRTSTSSAARAARISGHASRLLELTVTARRPMRAAALIWLRISASRGLMMTVGPSPAVAQHPGRDPVDEALAPAGALHHQHPGTVRRSPRRWHAAGRSGTWCRVRPSDAAAARAGRDPSLEFAGHGDRDEVEVVDARVVRQGRSCRAGGPWRRRSPR